MKESFIFLADGFEEIEALTVIDVLRRAEMPVKTVSISSSEYVTGAHGVTVKADTLFDKQLLSDPEWLILPGGMPGATNLYEHEQLREILVRHNDEKKKIAAICAAPAVVLGQLGILNGKRATCYPGFENLCAGAEMIDSPVVVDDNIVCGNGPANALVWALNIASIAKDEQAALHIANGMLYYPKACDDVDYCFG